jgi:membrane-associated phospholipid phosphatase
MKLFIALFKTLPRNLGRCFVGMNLLWHVLAIALTSIFVFSGLDWWLWITTRSGWPQAAGFLPALIGFFVPIILPVIVYTIGALVPDRKLQFAGVAVAQAEMIGWIVSSVYKSFTGRIPPPHYMVTDISTVFHLGFLKGGIFWGWPSSHTTVAFAMAAALWVLFSAKKIRIVALLYALFIGLGVAVTIHWFSDFVAGAIVGSVIGVTVAKGYMKDALTLNASRVSSSQTP